MLNQRGQKHLSWSLFLALFYFFSSISEESFLVHAKPGHNHKRQHHHHHHHHHSHVDDTSPAFPADLVRRSVNQSTNSTELSNALSIIGKAHIALATANALRLENVNFNKYEFQTTSSRTTSDQIAPLLQYANSTSQTSIEKRTKSFPSLNHSISGNSNDSVREYAYTLPKEVIEAARVVAESTITTSTVDDASLALVAALEARYASKNNDTNAMPQALLRPNGLDGRADVQIDLKTSEFGNQSAEHLTKRDIGYWMATIPQNGFAPFAPVGYKVWRNVKEYGAKGDGITDDTAAINRAISDGARCGQDCGSSTTHPAVVWFPPGTYLVSSPLIQYYYTEMIGDPTDLPTILAASSFVGLGVITSDVYVTDSDEWYLNTNNFFRSVRNFKIDITATDQNAYVCAIHWQVAQATSLENIYFYMAQSDQTTQQGIYMENGSGGFMADLTFVGGNYGAYFGNQQFTTSHLTFVNCKTALQVGLVLIGGGNGDSNSGQGVGSLILTDAIISNTPSAIITSLYTQNSTSFLLQNVGFYNVKTAVQDSLVSKVLLDGGDSIQVASWGFGLFSSSSGTSTFANGETVATMNRSSALTGSTAYVKSNWFTRRRPKYDDIGAAQIIDAKTYGAHGDGETDDTAILNSLFAIAANMSSIVFIPHGIYVIKDTINVPLGSRIIGQAWSQIMATGAKFQDMSNPRVAVQVGKAGDVGIVEIQDMLFGVSGPTAGVVLVQWNIHQSSQGSSGLWDSHIRIGGAAGSQLQAKDCPKLSGQVNQNCVAASMLLHLTRKSSAYLENVWVWVADHDMDTIDQTQIDIYSARGILVESQGPTWLYGTASEHSILYQYQLSGARNTFLGMIQTESPYFQGPPLDPSPVAAGLFPEDPTFSDCTSGSTTCYAAWAVRIIDSKTIYLLGAGIYSWFSAYSQDCLVTENCQDRAFQTEESFDIWIYNLVTKGIVEMISPFGEVPTYARDNVNGYMSSILAWLGGVDQLTGSRNFTGFQIYDLDELEDLNSNFPERCLTALTQVVKCDIQVLQFGEPTYGVFYSNISTANQVCDTGCEVSLSQWFSQVQSSCAGFNVTEAPATKVGGTIWQSWNMTCLKDSTDLEYCSYVIDDFSEVSTIEEMPPSELCSYCYVAKLTMMQSSQYSAYNEMFENNLKYVNQVCGLSYATGILPPLISAPEVDDFCLSDVKYESVDGDTCDSIARSKSVSSAGIFMSNEAIQNCSSINAGTEVCLPLECQTYTIKSGDTCLTIENETSMNIGSLRKYNPWINYQCSNLNITNLLYGNVVCISPQGGTFNNTATQDFGTVIPVYQTGYAPAIVPAASNATIAKGTTLRCGLWVEASSIDTCASICIQNGITISLFLQINPSLLSASCSASLVSGFTYCAGPVKNWQYLPSAAGDVSSTTTSTSATSTATIDACSSATAVSVNFRVTKTTTDGEKFRLIGSTPSLGAWDIGSSVSMSNDQYSVDDPTWETTVSFAVGIYIEYKYLHIHADGSITWSSDPNFSFTITANCKMSTTNYDSWRS